MYVSFLEIRDRCRKCELGFVDTGYTLRIVLSLILSFWSPTKSRSGGDYGYSVPKCGWVARRRRRILIVMSWFQYLSSLLDLFPNPNSYLKFKSQISTNPNSRNDKGILLFIYYFLSLVCLIIVFFCLLIGQVSLVSSVVISDNCKSRI